MSSKKKEGKKGKEKAKTSKKDEYEESITDENPNWEQELRDAVIDENSCAASIVVESESNQMEATKQFVEALCSGIRRPVKLIMKSEIFRTISQAGTFKTNPNRPKFYQVCEKAQQELKEEGAISPYLWSLLIKFQLLDLFEKYTAQKIKEEIYRAEEAQKERQQPKLWAPCAEDKTATTDAGSSPRKRDGGKSGKSSKSDTTGGGGKAREKGGKSPERGGKSPGKGGKSPERGGKTKDAGSKQQQAAIFDKPDSKIRVKGEEWKDIPYLDDSPAYGPSLYVFIMGFYDARLPQELLKAGIPLLCFVNIISLTPPEDNVPENPRESILTENSNAKEISSSEAVNSNQEKRKPFERVITTEEMETQKELNNFWNGLLEDEMALNTLENVPIIPYDLPEMPSTPEDQPDFKKKLYDQLSNTLYDVIALKRLYSIFVQKIKVWFTDVKDTLQDVDKSHYEELMDEIPPECITVPIIVDCMLQQVIKTNEDLGVVLETETDELKEEKDIVRIMQEKITQLNIENGFTNILDEDTVCEDPQVIANKDSLLKRIYRYKGDLNLSSMTYDVLKTIPVFNLWENISPLKELEKINYAQSIKRLMELFNDECVEFNVASSLLCLLKFEEMLESMNKRTDYKSETSSLNTYVLPTSKIIGRYGSHLLTKRHADSIASVTREYGGRIFQPNDNENDLKKTEDKQLTIVPIQPAYTPCKTQEGDEQEENLKASRTKEVKVLVKKGCIEVLKYDTSNEASNAHDSRSTQLPKEQEEDAPFYCGQILDLKEQRDDKNLFWGTGCPGFIEELSEKVLLQVLYEGLCEYGNLDCCYFPPCDALLVMFCKEEGLTEVYWKEKLPTPVSFREFYDNILQEETEWLVEQERIYHESIKQASLESPDKAEEEESTGPSPPCDKETKQEDELDPSSLAGKEEYILEGTLKYEDIMRSKMPKEPFKVGDQGQKNKKESKSSKSKKSGKQQETEDVPSPVPAEVKPPAVEATPSTPSPAEANRSEGSLRERKSISKPSFLRRGQRSIVEIKDEEEVQLPQEEKDEGNIPQVYDLGQNGGRFSGKSVNFVSPNGETIISVDSREMLQSEQVLTFKVQQGTDCLYHSFVIPPKALRKGAPQDGGEEVRGADLGRGRPLDEATSFHVVSEATGAVAAFCYQTFNPTPRRVDSYRPRESTEKVEKTRVVSAHRRHSGSRTSSSKGMKESKSKIKKLSGSFIKDNLTAKTESEEKHTIFSDMPGFALKLSLPSGLMIENKWASGSLGPFYIKQSYISKGKIGDRFDEVFRLFLQNGNILKFMKNGPVTILHSSGRICYLNTRRKDSGDGPDDDTVFTEPTGRRYRETPGSGFVVDLPRCWVRKATDLEANEVFWTREDGVRSMLRADGSLTVIFTDGTRIASTPREEEDPDGFVLVSLDFVMEHPLYATVTLDGRSTRLTVGHEDICLTVSPDGTYRMATAEQVNMDVTTSFVKMSKGHSESTLFFNIADRRASRYELEGGARSRGKDLCITDDGWGNIFTVGVDGSTSLTRTEDFRGDGEGEVPARKRFLVLKRNGSGSEFVPRWVIRDSLQESKRRKDVSVTRYPCDGCLDQNCPQSSHFMVMFRPVSNKERYFLESDMKCSIARSMASNNLPRSTYWYPEAEGSTRKPVPRWFHPLPKADFKESGYPKMAEKAPPAFACKYCHPESHEESRHLPMPDAFSLLVVRQLGSLGKERGDIQMTEKLISSCLRHQESSQEEEILSRHQETCQEEEILSRHQESSQEEEILSRHQEEEILSRNQEEEILSRHQEEEILSRHQEEEILSRHQEEEILSRHQESSQEEEILSRTYSEEIRETTSGEGVSIEFKKESETEISVSSWLGFLDESAWSNGASDVYFSGLVEKVGSFETVEEEIENNITSTSSITNTLFFE